MSNRPIVYVYDREVWTHDGEPNLAASRLLDGFSPNPDRTDAILENGAQVHGALGDVIREAIAELGYLNGAAFVISTGNTAPNGYGIVPNPILEAFLDSIRGRRRLAYERLMRLRAIALEIYPGE